MSSPKTQPGSRKIIGPRRPSGLEINELRQQRVSFGVPEIRMARNSQWGEWNSSPRCLGTLRATGTRLTTKQNAACLGHPVWKTDPRHRNHEHSQEALAKCLGK